MQSTNSADMSFVCVLGKDMTWKTLVCQHLGRLMQGECQAGANSNG